MQKLRDQIINNQLAKRQEYFLLDIDLTRERFLADKRQLQAIITNPNASVKIGLMLLTLIFSEILR